MKVSSGLTVAGSALVAAVYGCLGAVPAVPVAPQPAAAGAALEISPGLAWTSLTGTEPSAASGSRAAGTAGEAPDPLPVAATLPPLGWLAERVGGPQVEVTVLIPPGRSPHTYEPTPRDVEGLRRARLVVRAGHPSLLFEERLLGMVQGEGGARQISLTAVAGSLGEPGLGGEPHPWLAPPVLAAAAGELARALGQLVPGSREAFDARAAELTTEMGVLDAELRERFAGRPAPVFLVDHPAWGAFAHLYGLTQLALEVDGKEPGPASLARILAQARRAGVRRLLVGAAPAGPQLRNVARSLGAEIAVLDPLAPDVPANLRRAADLILGSPGQ